MNEKWIGFAFIWMISLLAAASVTTARVGYWLYGRDSPEPPSDDRCMHHWRRRRQWIVISEASALPAFASMALAVTVIAQLDLIFAPPIAIGMSLTGFLLLVDGVQRRFREWIGLKENGSKHDF